jgi:hypothetical protein
MHLNLLMHTDQNAHVEFTGSIDAIGSLIRLQEEYNEMHGTGFHVTEVKLSNNNITNAGFSNFVNNVKGTALFSRHVIPLASPSCPSFPAILSLFSRHLVPLSPPSFDPSACMGCTLLLPAI